MEVYTVYAYDLNTNTLLTQLPASGLTFDSRLNDSGSIDFTLQLSKPQAAVLAAPILPYAGNPFAVYVDRNGVIVWGGIIWTWLYTKSSGTLELSGKEWGSYFDQRVLAADYSVTTYPSGLDPAALVFKVFNDAQNTTLCGPGSNIGASIAGGTSGIPALIPAYPLTQRTTVYSVAQDMANISSPGQGTVDTSFQSAWNPATGAPMTTLTIASPRAGRAAGSTGLIFDLSRALDYTWPTDATLTGTTIFVTGAGSGSAMIAATVNSSAPVGGLGQLPRLDLVSSFPDIQSQPQLSSMAAGVAQRYGEAVPTPTVTVPTAGATPLGSWIAGDDARLYTPGDEFFPNGLDQYWRIVQYATTVPDDGVPYVELTFNTVPIF